MIIDTQILIWTIWDKWDRLGPKAKQLLLDKEGSIIISAASLLEIRLKQRRNKLSDHSIASILNALKLTETILLPITAEHVLQVPDKSLTPHADPFDLLIVAQAISEKIPLITSDAEILKIKHPDLQLIDAKV
jgi:PIN domain nuclease of toxin-antitoxin system